MQTSGGLTATLNRLERAGHIERRADPEDGRGRLVAITDEGIDFADRALAALTAEYEAAFSGVDADRALIAVRSLIDVLERRVDHSTTGDWTVAAESVGSPA